MNQSPLTVAVVGLSKIVLPLAVQFAQHGCRVIGCDINSQVVDMTNTGQSHIQEEPGLATALTDVVHKGSLSATLNTADAVSQAAVVVVIVPVGIDARHEVDFASIDAATAAIGDGYREKLEIQEKEEQFATSAQDGRYSQQGARS